MFIVHIFIRLLFSTLHTKSLVVRFFFRAISDEIHLCDIGFLFIRFNIFHSIKYWFDTVNEARKTWKRGWQLRFPAKTRSRDHANVLECCHRPGPRGSECSRMLSQTWTTWLRMFSNDQHAIWLADSRTQSPRERATFQDASDSHLVSYRLYCTVPLTVN